jgi:spore coat protein U-like protein
MHTYRKKGHRIRCEIQLGRLATKTTITAQYAAVAEKISKLRVSVRQSDAANVAVKITTAQSLEPVFSTLYKITIGTVSVATAKIAVRNRATVAIRSAEKWTMLLSDVLLQSR